MLRISVEAAQELIASDQVTIIDVRDEAAFQTSHIKEAIHVQRDNLQELTNQFPKAQPILVYCYRGNTSQVIGQYLTQLGFDKVYSMDGGFEEWQEKNISLISA